MEQSDLLNVMVGCFESMGISYLITGSMAAMAYGEPRLTNDIDLVADLKNKQVDELLKHFPSPEFYISKDAVLSAIKGRGQFNIIHPGSGLKADIIIPKWDAFDLSRFERARRLRPTKEHEAAFASPEDVILKKLVFHQKGGSDKHPRDIAGIVKVSTEDLDFNYLGEWAEKLGVGVKWTALLRELGINNG